MFSLFPHRRCFALLLALLICSPLLSLVLVACVSSTSSTVSSRSGAVVKTSLSSVPTNDLLTPGVLTIGSDTTYAPQEFIDTTTNQPAGFDIDLITAIAQRLHLKTKIVPDSFSSLLNNLQSHEFDIAISAIGITAERQRLADFIPYFRTGESLLVQKGDPLHIQSLSDLCGRKVAVLVGTIEYADLHIASNACSSSHKAAIDVIVFNDQNTVIHMLLTHQVVATYQDAPVSDYFVKLNPTQLVVGGVVADWNLEGIAVRKGNVALFRAIQTAFDAIKTGGLYTSLLAKWGLSNEQVMILPRHNLDDA